MKIESLQTRVVRKAFAKAQWNPRTRWTENVVVLVLLRAEGGLLGLGEAYCDGGAPDSVQAIIERDFAPLVVGRSVFDLGALSSLMRESMVVSAKGGAAWARQNHRRPGHGDGGLCGAWLSWCEAEDRRGVSEILCLRRIVD